MPRALFAHAFGQSYVLPVPFWLYTFGAVAALFLSFAVIGYLSGARPSAPSLGRDITSWRIIRFLRSRIVVFLAKALTLFLFLLTILSGFIGENSSLVNINMTLFWIVFLLGMTYVSALFGTIWDTINPLRLIYRWYAGARQSIRKYPEKLGIWPALAAYVVLIWLELVGRSSPLSLSIALSIYAVWTFLGAWIFGEEAWFARAEFFSVFFGIIARMAPIAIRDGTVRLRSPFVGLLESSAQGMSELWFVLFMIASTSFDGFQDTLPMLRLYLQGFKIVPSYDFFRTACLFLSPVIFFLLYGFCIWLAKRMARSTLALKELMQRYAYTLVPIALAYNVAHYYTLLLVQGQHIFHLISDPLGYGWNIFGTAGFAINIGIVQAGFIWHSQVIALLIGHIAGVYLAHDVSMRIFESKKKALLSELPMLALMMAFTVIGLWILAQPLVTG